MELALRPYVTAGVGVAAAGLIAVTPVAGPSLELQQRAVQLTSAAADVLGGASAADLGTFTNPITEWLDVFSTTADNLQKLADIVLADPFPIMSQILSNQLGYADTLAGGLESASSGLAAFADGLPAVLQTALGDIASGQILTGVGDIWNYAVSFGKGGLLIPINDLFTATESVAEGMAGNADKFVDALFTGNPTISDLIPELAGTTSPLGLSLASVIFPVHAGLAESATLAQDIVTAMQDGQYLTALSDIVNAPAYVTDAILNGTTATFGPSELIGVLGFPGSGLLTSTTLPSPLPFGSGLFPALEKDGTIFALLWARLALAHAIEPAHSAAASASDLTGAAGSSGLPDLSTMLSSATADLSAALNLGDLSAIFDPAGMSSMLSGFAADIPTMLLGLIP
ncbi:hypothetical protein [Mycobacterium botniense]|uniref:PE-PGRS family protein n=1 Tax=Mycobacterium botniense TaxID=84962 RepID=A0A7I9Y2C9_9MYCO|nr:hypothetical protein [Mycobacterium botniense]GFG76184.1 hypothetical protein MBOT_35490 [Mycobacterium botniense]